ncbi:MAG TPA: YlxR family protein [Candidatus Dormibacteraeota bacterium]|nr:YlxR family protein [Candidatus Dormibacteraeota bacterium]
MTASPAPRLCSCPALSCRSPSVATARTPVWRPSSPVTGSTSSRASQTAKHHPVRTCVTCRQEAGKRELVRLVRRPDGSVELDPTGKKPGRGAYVHASAECVEGARKRRLIERALGAPVPAELWAEVSNLLRPA